MAFVCTEKEATQLSDFTPDESGVTKDDLVKVTLVDSNVFYIRHRSVHGRACWVLDDILLPREFKKHVEDSKKQFFYPSRDIAVGQTPGVLLRLHGGDRAVMYTIETAVQSLEAVKRPSRRAAGIF